MTKSRVTNVQVPGETAPAANEPETSQPQATAAEPQVQASSESEKQEVVTDAHVGGVFDIGAGAASGAGAAIDIEALRNQIRAEERAKLMSDFDAEMAAARHFAAKAAAEKLGAAQGARAEPGIATARSYKDMRAHEVDASTLTAPVLTKDGWVCPSNPPTLPAAFKQ